MHIRMQLAIADQESRVANFHEKMAISERAVSIQLLKSVSEVFRYTFNKSY